MYISIYIYICIVGLEALARHVEEQRIGARLEPARQRQLLVRDVVQEALHLRPRAGVASGVDRGR